MRISKIPPNKSHQKYGTGTREVYLFQNEGGRVKPTENKEKAGIIKTDLVDGVTTYYHRFQ